MTKHSRQWKKAMKILKDLNMFNPPESDRDPLAFGYARVSHIGSVRIGASMPRQREIIRNHYRYLTDFDHPGLGWGGIFEDEVTSAYEVKIVNRKGGRKLCRAVHPRDHIIIPYLDRAFRNFRDAMDSVEQWKARNINVHFCDFRIDTSTAEGWLMLGQLALLAEYQSRSKSERIKASLKNKKLTSKGNPYMMGFPPYGFRIEGKGKDAILVPEPRQIQWGKWIVTLHDKEGLNWKQIADKLNAHTIALAISGDTEFLAWRDKEWYTSRVRSWYKREKDRQKKAMPA